MPPLNFNSLLNSFDHCEDAVISFSKESKLDISNKDIVSYLKSHPNYPSLASIKDFLFLQEINSEAYYLDCQYFDGISNPFIAQVQLKDTKHPIFAVIKSVSENSITFHNTNTKKTESWKRNDFNKIYQGIVLIVDYESVKKRASLSDTEKKKSGSANYLEKTGLGLIGLVLIFQISDLLIKNTLSAAVYFFTFALLIFFGLGISVLLILYEISEDNAGLKSVCKVGKKVNCAAILNSKAAKILGTSWSQIGFSYFASFLISFLIFGFNNIEIKSILSYTSILTLPYILYSVYYQWKVVKQWCLLCLLVQVTLLSIGLLVLLGGFFNFGLLISLRTGISFVTIYILCFLVISNTIRILKENKDSKNKNYQLLRLKNTPSIFYTFLKRQKPVAIVPTGLGIKLGNSRAKYKLIKVCNPYCTPCSKSHEAIQFLIEKIGEDVEVQIIFSARGEDDEISPPVRHFMEISKTNDERLIKEALHDWYSLKDKNYEFLIKKYPLNIDIEQRNKELMAMRSWCDNMGIESTPTFFLNGNKFPDSYSIFDVKRILLQEKLEDV